MQHLSRNTFWFVCLFLLLFTVTLATISHAAPANEPQQSLPESAVIDRWQRYEASDYGFALEYPADWEITTLIEQSRPYPEPEKIVRKYAFAGSEGYVTLSVFLIQGLELSSWLENQNRISPDLFPAMEANAGIAGYPALAVVIANDLILFVNAGQYVYRFWHPVSGSTAAIQAIWHMLNTFRTGEFDSAYTGAQIPQSITDGVQDAIEAARNQINDHHCPGVQGEGCCADAPAISACYRFPCSIDNGEHKGNCTYYVCYQYGGVPFTGHAWKWWGQVPTTPGWYQHNTPPNGTSIAWWGKTSTMEYGHVGHIPSYWGGGSPIIYEQNWCVTCTRQRPSWYSAPHGYIQKGPQPMMAPTLGQ